MTLTTWRVDAFAADGRRIECKSLTTARGPGRVVDQLLEKMREPEKVAMLSIQMLSRTVERDGKAMAAGE